VLPDYVPGTQPGDWQPQPGIVNPVFRQFATMTPWTMTSPSQFRPAARPSLTSPDYLADLAQVRALGNAATVTPENLATAKFWAGQLDTVGMLWDRTAQSLVLTRDWSLTRTARFFALLNLSMADSAIAVWDAKNAFNFWRPITAIQHVDPTWKSALPTPNHQEFPSGHSGASGAAAAMLAAFFGEDATFTVVSDGLPTPGNARTGRAGAGDADAAAPRRGESRRRGRLRSERSPGSAAASGGGTRRVDFARALGPS
jgi:hypothetical protein